MVVFGESRNNQINQCEGRAGEPVMIDAGAIFPILFEHKIATDYAHDMGVTGARARISPPCESFVLR
jgi:hypothetical protein